VGDGEKKCVGNPRSITSGTLRQYWCGMLREECVKTSTYLYLGFLCIYRLLWSVFWLVCICRCSIVCLTQSMCGFLAQSLAGRIAIHCIPILAGTVLVGHCGTFVVTLSL
jgi:hypothetical protein